jgi:plasmid virulence protein D
MLKGNFFSKAYAPIKYTFPLFLLNNDLGPFLPADIVERMKYTSKMPKYSALAKALKALPSKGDSRINPETLDREKLSSIASQVNAAPYLHFTGNCALLSACMLYNLIRNKVILGAGNIYPITKGLSPSSVQMLLFGES